MSLSSLEEVGKVGLGPDLFWCAARTAGSRRNSVKVVAELTIEFVSDAPRQKQAGSIWSHETILIELIFAMTQDQTRLGIGESSTISARKTVLHDALYFWCMSNSQSQIVRTHAL